MNTKMTSWQRLEAVIHYARMTTNAFAKSLSLKRSENLYQIKKGNNGISKELADLIVEKYPEVDKLWLLTGEGTMFSEDTSGVGANSTSLRLTRRGVPFYDVDLMGVLKNRAQFAPSCFMDVPIAGDCDFVIKFHGAAMDPVIKSGSLVFAKEVNTDLIMFGEIYLVVTPSFAAIRHIGTDHTDPSKLRLVAANATFEDIPIPKRDITSLYIIKGVYQSFI